VRGTFESYLFWCSQKKRGDVLGSKAGGEMKNFFLWNHTNPQGCRGRTNSEDSSEPQKEKGSGICAGKDLGSQSSILPKC